MTQFTAAGTYAALERTMTVPRFARGTALKPTPLSPVYMAQRFKPNLASYRANLYGHQGLYLDR